MNFKHIVNGSPIPAFPGAYIFTGNFSSAGGAVAVPIYRSGNIPIDVHHEFFGNKDHYVYVLPGYKIEIYQYPDYDVNTQYAPTYSTPAYTVDNTNGTEILFQKSVGQLLNGNLQEYPNTINSYKLFFKGSEL